MSPFITTPLYGTLFNFSAYGLVLFSWMPSKSNESTKMYKILYGWIHGIIICATQSTLGTMHSILNNFNVRTNLLHFPRKLIHE